jgi:hypothetical protein
MRAESSAPDTLKVLFLIDPILGADRVAQAREEDMKAARWSDHATEKALWGLSYTSGGDGFLLSPTVTRPNIAEIADGLAPALRKRGLLGDGYRHSTFRENLLEF